MGKLKQLLGSVGLAHSQLETVSSSELPLRYEGVNNKEITLVHRDYLKSIEEEENNRLTLIESKTSQMVSQTGIIFSLLSLFVPILIDKVAESNLSIKLLLVTLLVTAFFFYVLTINNALKNFNVQKFSYGRRSTKNVINLQFESVDDFWTEEVKDLLYCINRNYEINNRKANNLIHSYNSFRMANISTGILVGVFSMTFLFFRPQKEGVRIETPIQIKGLDSFINSLNKSIKNKKDTVYVKYQDAPESENNQHLIKNKGK